MSLTRSAMKPGTKGLARSAFKPKPAAERKPMRQRGPKMTPIRKSANGEECTLRFPCCRGDTATVVWCHSNRGEDGKCAGKKARDPEGCYGCFACHAFLDGGYAGHMPRTLVDKYFDLARTESQKILKKKGLML